MSITTEKGERLTEAEWLARRKRGIGASEAPAALGIDPYCSTLELWARKTGKLADRETSLAMRAGKALEPLLAELYAEKSGNPIVQQQVMISHPTLPLFATLDAIDDTDTPVEFKTIRPQRARDLNLGPDDSDEVPETWAIQVHLQMYLHDSEVANIACLIGHDDFRIYTVQRHQPLIDEMIPGLLGFWTHVESGNPPDFITAAPQLLNAIYPPVPDEFEGDEAIRDAVDRYEQLGHRCREIDRQRDAAKGEILAACRGRQCLLPDGRRVALKQAMRQSYTVKGGMVTRMDILKARA